MMNNNPFRMPNTLNLPESARDTLSGKNPDPGKFPSRDSRDKYVLIFTVIGILIGCTIGALAGTLLGGLNGTFIGLVAGLFAGGFIGVFTGDFLKKRFSKKRTRGEKEENSTEPHQGPFIN